MALLDVVIDVSHGQGDIDWRSVAEAGIKVAMVKATEGHTFTDSAWHANLRGATQAGIKVIPYHFLRAGAAEDQAAHFRDVVGLKHGMAYALDWEGTRTAAAADVEQMGRILAEITRRNPVVIGECRVIRRRRRQQPWSDGNDGYRVIPSAESPISPRCRWRIT